MGWYLHRNIRLGLLCINLSRRRVGYRVSVHGARIGRSAQGRPYVQAGRGGVYYRGYMAPRDRR